MKKGLLALAAGMLLGVSASFGAAATQLYLIGEPAGGWSPLNGSIMTQTEPGVFTIDVELTAMKWFGFSQKLGNSGNDWDTMNKARYGAPNNNYEPAIGETVSLKYPSENSFQLGAGKYTFTVNTNNNTFVVTGQEVVDPEADVMYFRGASAGWDATASNKMTQNGNTYTYTIASLSGEFKIANKDYSQQFSTSTPIPNGTTVSVSNIGMTNCTLADGTLKDVTITFVKESKTEGKLTISGTKEDNPGPDPGIDYSNWYVNIVGPFNGWGDNGVNPVDTISTHTNLAIGTQGFKVKVYNGSADTYYVTDGSAIPLDTWTPLFQDAYDASPNQIEGATETSVYDVKYNVATNQVFVTLVGGNDPEPTYPESVYMIGNVNGGSFAANNGVQLDNEGDGIFTITDVKINKSDNDYGYIQFSENLGADANDWSGLGIRYGAAAANTEVVLEEELAFTKGENSFKILPGTYTITLNFEDMTMYVEGTPDPVVPTEPAIYTGTISNTKTISDKEYQYSFDYIITYNTDKTLSFNVEFSEDTNLPGLAPGEVGINNNGWKFFSFTLADGVRTVTTTDTYEIGTALEIDFRFPIEGNMTSDKINYTVGDDNYIPEVNEYAGWYLNVIGSNGNLADGVEFSKDGTAKVENVAIGTGTFEIKIWNGTADTYYSNGSAVAVGEWVELPTSQATQMTVVDATENSVYNVEWNQTTKSVKLTLVSGGNLPEEPVFTDSATSSVEQTINGTTKTYNYTLNYSIKYNADKTLTVSAQYVWENEAPVGAENFCYTLINGAETQLKPGAQASPRHRASSNVFTGTTTQTYENGAELTVHFKMPVAEGAAEVDVPNYIVGSTNIQSGVENIEAAENAEAIYFNLNGVRVNNPTKGIYIKVVNGKSSKVMF